MPQMANRVHRGLAGTRALKVRRASRERPEHAVRRVSPALREVRLQGEMVDQVFLAKGAPPALRDPQDKI